VRPVVTEEAAAVETNAAVLAARLDRVDYPYSRIRQALAADAEQASRDADHMAVDFLRSLAGRIPEWAEEFVPSTSSFINPLKTPDQVRAAAREITDYLSERLDRAVRSWIADDLSTSLRDRIERLNADLSPLFEEFAALLPRLGEIEISWAAIHDAGQTVSGSLSRKSYSDIIAAALPVISGSGLTGGLITTGIFALAWSKTAVPELRRQVAIQVQNEIRGNAAAFGGQVGESVAEQYDDLWRRIDQEVDARRELFRDASREVGSRSKISRQDSNSALVQYLARVEDELDEFTRAIAQDTTDE
jgi:hypothetical protein